MKLARISLMIFALTAFVSAGKFKVKRNSVDLQGDLPSNDSPVGTERSITVQISGDGPRTVKVKKQKTGSQALYEAPEGSSFSAGKSTDSSLACFKKQGKSDDDQTCVMDLPDKSCFTKRGDALCFDHPPPNLISDEVEPPSVSASGQGQNNRRNSLPHSRRERRSLLPGMVDTGFVRIVYFPDGEFANLFLDFAGGNLTRAKEDIEMYFLLVTNEITVMYQTMTNRSIITITGQPRNLDLAIHMMGVVLPGNNSIKYNDPSWSVVDSNGFLQSPLGSFRTYMRNTYSGPYPYDTAMAVTGYTLEGKIGVAYVATACHLLHIIDSNNVAIAEGYGGLDRLLAHEIAHILGIRHDTNSTECPLKTYIMSNTITSSTKPSTYDTFSNCSVDNITDYLNSLGGQYSTGCLYNNSITDEKFIKAFCVGSYQSLSFDDQCRIKRDTTSTSCNSFSNWFNSTHVKRCDNRGIKCTNATGHCTSYLNEVADGTPCIVDNQQEPRFCFKALCQPVQTWCTTTTTTTPTTTTTTTPPPTTTTTTTPPPTTTTTTTPPPTTTTTTTPPPTTTTTTTPPPTTTTTTTPPPTTTTTTTPPPTTTTTTTPPPTTTTTTTPPPTTTTTTTQQPSTSSPCPSFCTSTTNCGVFTTRTDCKQCCCCRWVNKQKSCALASNYMKCNRK